MSPRLRQRRKSFGWTQEELAKRARVSRATISYLENQRRACIRTDTLVKLADALDSRVTDLFF